MITRLDSSIVLLAFILGTTDAFVSSTTTTRARCCHARFPHVRSFTSSALELRKDAREPENNIIRSNITLENEITLEFKLHSSIASIPPEAWNACLPTNKDGLGSAFLDYSWLYCLEESKCASPQTGWVPQHDIRVRTTAAATFAPSYLLSNRCYNTEYFLTCFVSVSLVGEFIFDSSWADAAYQNKIDYYPKLLVAVPFTPARGNRILWHASVYDQYKTAEITQLRQAAAMFLRQMAIANKMSSVHINFLCDEEAADIADPMEPTEATNQKQGVKSQVQAWLQKLSAKDEYIRRSSIQYHWKNRNPVNDGEPYRSFDEYLSCFKSKRRINIRRERKKVADEGIRIDVVREALKARDVFAGTFNVVKDGVFYGRYWGCLGEEIKNLHFETCYWSAIEYCIEKGIKRMEPGAGGGDYKWARGFDPALIHSVHYICHPGLRRAISQFVEYETENNVEVAEYLQSRRAAQVLTANQVVGK
eukprot:scaffold1428_cov159-Amphora_coffeaeformis.AAC.8